MLERSTPHNPAADVDQVEAEPEPARAGAPAPKKAKPSVKRTGRTIYLSEDLFERIIVQAHRRKRTISEYVEAILERQVPDHRVIRGKDAPEPVEGTPGDVA